MWFNTKDLNFKNIIKLPHLRGYVLPHAGTEFTGNIISHTLRFRPTKVFTQVVILYYPASNVPDIVEKDDGKNIVKYYHEYYVPLKSMKHFFKNNSINYTGYNIKTDKIPELDLSTTLIVVSADFSHFMPFQKSVDLENKAAHALMFKKLLYGEVVDDLKTFKVFFDIIPDNFQLQWVGRERSSGENKAVGYLSFLLRETPKIKQTKIKPNGMFITVYSKDMVARECLGKWFNNQKWSLKLEQQFRDEVILMGETKSRLTNGSNIEKPLTHYSVTYLYKDTINPFIRGWHGILHHAFFLPDVLLENTFNNGEWIKSTHTKWMNADNFDLTETLNHLKKKAGITTFSAGEIKRGIHTKRKNNNTKRNTIKKIYGGYNNIKNTQYTLYSSSVKYVIM